MESYEFSAFDILALERIGREESARNHSQLPEVERLHSIIESIRGELDRADERAGHWRWVTAYSIVLTAIVTGVIFHASIAWGW